MLKISKQVLLVYLQPICRNTLWKCALQPKIAKILTKTPLFGFKAVQGHWCC